MGRRKVVQALLQHGCVVLRDTGGHTVCICPDQEHRAPAPRHTTISAGVVGSIERAMACLPKGWLQA